MDVRLIAATTLFQEYLGDGWTRSADGSDPENLIEFAGRMCYQSWDRPNPATATNRSYLANLIRQGHGSVFEHASATFAITGIPRYVTHELIRHRHLSFSEVSQRYVDPTSDLDVRVPDMFLDGGPGQSVMENVFRATDKAYADLISLAEARGESDRKRIREAARAVLPEMTETRIVVSGNFRAWMEYLEARCSPKVDAAHRAMALEIRRQMDRAFPHVFSHLIDGVEK